MTKGRMKEGALVVYREKPAVINGLGDKITITVDNGQSKKVRPKDIIFLHSGPISSTGGLTPLNGHIEDTLEMLEDEEVSFQEFAELLFEDFTPQSAWNAYTLLKEGKYFTGDIDNGVKGRSRSEIAAVEEAEAAKERQEAERAEFIKRVRHGSLLPEDMKAMREVEHVALGTNSSSSIMRDLNMSATPEKAHALLLKTGVWTDKNDPWPQRNNIDMTIPELPVPDLPEEARRDLTHLPAYAIDDPNNQDPDDALSFDFETGIFWVHVADVAALAPSGSELDNEARARGANLYIPEQVVPMLPDDITKKLGLGLQEISPALSFALKVSESGEPELLEVVPTLIKVDRITYGDADERLDEKLFAEMRSITSRFQQRRFENGAVIIDMPEVKIKIAEDDSINFMPINTSPGRELVTNAMLMCGEAVGKFAYANHLPIPYTVQEMADEELAAGESLAGMFARRKQMRPSMQSLMPGRHAGLGMDIYSRVTSPLRRYSDLLVHQQIRAFVLGQQTMDADTVDARIAESERSAGQTRSTERTVNEFWTLVYLLRRPDWEGTAVVIDKTDHKSTIVIPELAYITKMRLHKEIELNDELDLRLINVNLPEMSAHFKYSSQK